MMTIVGVLFAAVLGALAGRVVALTAHWLPPILFEEGVDEDAEPSDIFFKHFFRNPRCLLCKERLSGLEALPIIGYLISRGHCSHCKKSAGLQGFILELVVAVIFVGFKLVLPFGPFLLFAWAVSAVLVACFVLDLQHYILPDQLTQTLLWVGLIGSLFSLIVPPQEAVFGAVLGYGFSYAFNVVYRFIRKRDGMFPGDFKMIAAIGACLGWQSLPYIVLIACASMVVFSLVYFGIVQKLNLGKVMQKVMPFGCYGAVVAFAALMAEVYVYVAGGNGV